MSFGVLSTGYVSKPIDDIIGDIEQKQLATIDPNLNQLPSSVFGNLNGIIGDLARQIYALGQAVYWSQYPDTAAGAALDAIAAITGAIRLAEAPSTVSLEVNLDAGTSLPIGRIIQNPTTNTQFITTEVVTNPGPGAANLAVLSECTVPGPTNAPAGTLTDIVTPVSGWNSVTNPLDADPGRNVESDPDFRTRREELLQITGAGTLESIRAAVRATPGVTQALGFENTTPVTNADGLPPHSFEIVALGGVDADVAQSIFTTKPAGIRAYGLQTEPIENSEGDITTIGFTRPSTIDIYADPTVSVRADEFPLDGVDQIKAAMVAYGDTLQIGRGVVALSAKCQPLTVPGVEDVTVFIIDTVAIPPGVNTGNISVSSRELVLFDTSRIDVTVVPI